MIEIGMSIVKRVFQSPDFLLWVLKLIMSFRLIKGGRMKIWCFKFGEEVRLKFSVYDHQ